MGQAKRRNSSGQHKSGQNTPGGRKRRQPGLIIIAVLAVVSMAIAGLWWITRPPAPTSTALPDVAEGTESFPAQFDSLGISLGDADAPVVVREFADYQCPACARFSSATDQLREKWVETGKVRFVFFELPLRQHENAVPAAMAARCAGDQGKFWDMHGQLFDHQSEWNTTSETQGMFTRYAEELGMDGRRFGRCLSTNLHREAIEQSLALSKQLRVTSTPTVYVDNIKLTQPGWAQLSAVVERELADSAE